ncbi:MAG: hypothetical protein ACF8PN_05510 [Phycisphaerales bacterium]
MTSRTNFNSMVSGRLVAIGLVLLCGASAADAGRRVIRFTNNTGQACDDLHIETAQGTTVVWDRTTPFDSERGGADTKKHNLYNATVANGASATVAMDCDEETFIINRWWWTSGGNAFADGARVDDIKGDNGSNRLSFLDGPATGDGLVLVSVGGARAVWNTSPGMSPEHSAVEFLAFLDRFDDGEFDSISSVLEQPITVLFVGNWLGDESTNLHCEVLQPDSSQRLDLDPVPAGLALEVAGRCPGQVIATAYNAFPFSQVAFYYSLRDGQSPLPGCRGVSLDLGSPTLAGVIDADMNGVAILQGNAPRPACGRVRLQAADLQRCETSNVERL